MKVALLAGGTGGAKLACGLRDLVGDGLTVIANPGDDIEIYDAYVSPDPDLITYRLAGVLDAQGYGIAGDTYAAMDQLREAGTKVWFQLGDQDLAVCRNRLAMLRAGLTVSNAHQRATAAFDTGGAKVLPATDQRIRARIRTSLGWRDVQQYLIADHAPDDVLDVEFEGAELAEMSPDVRTALSEADLIVIGPSNPVLSITPMLAIADLRSALTNRGCPAIGVSPFVDGKPLKGPTAAFMNYLGEQCDTAAIARYYDGLLDHLIADTPGPEVGVNVVLADVSMHDEVGQRNVAQSVLDASGRE